MKGLLAAAWCRSFFSPFANISLFWIWEPAAKPFLFEGQKARPRVLALPFACQEYLGACGLEAKESPFTALIPVRVLLFFYS